jgi:hypothetical protein
MSDKKSWKTKTNLFWLMKSEFWRIFSKTDEYFAINEFTRSKKKIRRDSALQNAMSDSRFRTNRKIELYKNVRFDDKINELQNDVRHNRCQRLKNRANERQDRLSLWQNSWERLRRTTHEIRTKNQSDLQVKQNVVRSETIFENLIWDVN